MPFGGKQIGAGRPYGSLNKATRELRAAAAAEGIMPAQLMLKNMRYFDREAELELRRQLRKPLAQRDFTRTHDLMNRAEACAVDCGQYYHPKLAALAAMRAPEPGATTLEAMLLALDGAANDDDRLLEGPVIDGKVDAAE